MLQIKKAKNMIAVFFIFLFYNDKVLVFLFLDFSFFQLYFYNSTALVFLSLVFSFSFFGFSKIIFCANGCLFVVQTVAQKKLNKC
jgi:hypothetical protein